MRKIKLDSGEIGVRDVEVDLRGIDLDRARSELIRWRARILEMPQLAVSWLLT